MKSSAQPSSATVTPRDEATGLGIDPEEDCRDRDGRRKAHPIHTSPQPIAISGGIQDTFCIEKGERRRPATLNAPVS